MKAHHGASAALGALLAAMAVFAGGTAFAQGGGRQDIARFDANGDGLITLAEIDAARAEGFTRRDANGDGQLSGQELGNRGGRIDTDGDGVVTRAEFMARTPPVMERFDANNDNVLDATEQAAARAAHQDRHRDHDRGGQG